MSPDPAASSAPLRAQPDSRGLPGWTYYAPELLPLEHERIFRRSWQLMCHEADLPAAGDCMALDLLDDRILVARHPSGGLHAYRDGNTDANPIPEPVEVEIMLGFIFVRLEGDGHSLAGLWEPYVGDLGSHRLPEVRPLYPLGKVEWDVNWKIIADNSLESYHVPPAHPALYRMIGDPVREDSLANGVSRGVNARGQRPLFRWSERAYLRAAPSAASYLPPEKREQLCFFSMFPNLSLDIYPELVRFLQVIPIGPQRSVIRIGVYGQPDATRETRLARYLNQRMDRVVMQEDRAICARTQRGAMSAHYEPGPLSDQEGALAEFHQRLRQAIPAIDHAVRPTNALTELCG